MYTEKTPPETGLAAIATSRVEPHEAGGVPPEPEPEEYDRRRRRRRKRRPERRSLGSYITPSVKAWIVLGLVLATLTATATWSYYLMEENESLRRKMASDAFNAKERIASLESVLNSPRMRSVVSLDLEPQVLNSTVPQRMAQIRRPENGVLLLNLAVSQQSDRWDIEMRDLTGAVRARLTTGVSGNGKIQVVLSDLEFNTYNIVARVRGSDNGFAYSFSLN